MITLDAYLEPDLATLRSALSIDSQVLSAAVPMPCDVISMDNPAIIQNALRSFHADRWGRPQGEAGPATARLSDLAEIVGALVVHAFATPDARVVFPLTFAASGPTAQPPGIDVMALNVTAHPDDIPLGDNEFFAIVEAKSSLGDDVDGPVSALQADLAKTDYYRLTDHLRLLKNHLRAVGNPNYRRVHQFHASNHSFVGVLLVDSDKIGLHNAVGVIQRRLDGRSTHSGIPITRAAVFAVPAPLTWITPTL